jgi:hypothetical protein
MPFQDSLLVPRPAWTPQALAVLARHELLTAEQVADRLDLAPVAVAQSFDALAAEGLLRRLVPSSVTAREGVAPIYALTRRALNLLPPGDETTRACVPRLARTLHHLEHEAERAHLGLLLERLHEARELKLLRFETRAAVIADVTLVHVKGLLHRVPLVADALAVVEIAGRVSALLVELDRGTISLRRMRLKLAGYHAWWRCGGPARRFGFSALRVLVLCPSPARLRALQAAAIDGSAGGTRFLWFAETRSYTARNPHALFEAHAVPALHEARPAALFTRSS